MMDGTAFMKETKFDKLVEIDAFLKLIVFSYYNLIDDKITYSRTNILKVIQDVQKSGKALNEIEDFLCDDLVEKYIRPKKHLFGLDYYAVNTGVKESLRNVKIGILDLKFELCTLSKNHYYVFEAKRLNKYSDKQDYYIDHGIQRFIKRTYYPESEVAVAGMIGFVEVDLIKNKKGRVTVNEIFKKLSDRIKKKSHIKTTKHLEYYQLKHGTIKRIDDFEHSYVSMHTRDDSSPFTLYHLFLDYYDLLMN